MKQKHTRDPFEWCTFQNLMAMKMSIKIFNEDKKLEGEFREFTLP